MAVVAPYSKYRKTNFKIAIFGGLLVAAVLAYDGYLSKYEWSHRQSFYQKHTINGEPDGTLLFNQRVSIGLLAIAVISAIWFVKVKDHKLVLDDNELIIDNKQKIPYASIEQIDRTHFDSKGFFIISYKKPDGQNALKAFSYKRYDNLKSLLDHLVTKIT
ncbi:MAG: hypothetical protein WC374_04550 [Phycisphaerae bacterium]|jgi:hypothetical protein